MHCIRTPLFLFKKNKTTQIYLQLAGRQTVTVSSNQNRTSEDEKDDSCRQLWVSWKSTRQHNTEACSGPVERLHCGVMGKKTFCRWVQTQPRIQAPTSEGKKENMPPLFTRAIPLFSTPFCNQLKTDVRINFHKLRSEKHLKREMSDVYDEDFVKSSPVDLIWCVFGSF